MRTAIKPIVIAVALAFATPAFAQFNVAPNPVNAPVSGQRVLSSGTGEVTATGSITTSGGTVTVLMSGVGTRLENAGTIQQIGTGRAIDNTVNNSSLTILNSGTISTVSTDAIRINTAATSISLTNSGVIQVTNGGQALDWAGITTGANSLTNQVGGLISAVNEDAVRPGQNGVITNAGTIRATPTVTLEMGEMVASGSDGIDLRVQKNATVTNTGTISGRHGIATDGENVGPSSLTVFNNAGTIQAVNGSGLNVDANNISSNPASALSVTANVTNALGATIKGGFLASTTVADGDGIDVDGVLTLSNSGDVLGVGAKGAGNNAEGIAAGGGSITNTATGRIIGSSTIPGGGAGNGILIDNSSGGDAIAATTVINSGLIQGESGFGIKIVGAFNDTVVNRGAIIGGNNSALDLGGGNDTLTLEGGAASIIGDVAGGTGTDAIVFDLGTGNDFAYSGFIKTFDTVEAKSGRATIEGAHRIDSDSALLMSGGTIEFANAGGPNGQTFASFSLTGDSTIDLDFTSLTFGDLGAVTAVRTLVILDYAGTFAFRFLGDLRADADFLALVHNTTINGRAAIYNSDGTFTNVLLPAPGTLALLGLGLCGLAGMRRRAGSITRERLLDVLR